MRISREGGLTGAEFVIVFGSRFPIVATASTFPQDSTGEMSRGAARVRKRHSKTVTNSTYDPYGFYFEQIFMQYGDRNMAVLTLPGGFLSTRRATMVDAGQSG